MNLNTSNKRKSFIKRHLDLICINAAAIIFFIVVSQSTVFSKAKLIIGIFIFFFFINIRLVFNCVKILRSLDSIEKHDFDRSDNKKIMIALLILASIMGLSVFLIITKAMIWTGIVIMLVSGCIFLCYEYTIKKAIHKRKLSK